MASARASSSPPAARRLDFGRCTNASPADLSEVTPLDPRHGWSLARARFRDESVVFASFQELRGTSAGIVGQWQADTWAALAVQPGSPLLAITHDSSACGLVFKAEACGCASAEPCSGVDPALGVALDIARGVKALHAAGVLNMRLVPVAAGTLPTGP
jgi:hypothetical protein